MAGEIISAQQDAHRALAQAYDAGEAAAVARAEAGELREALTSIRTTDV